MVKNGPEHGWRGSGRFRVARVDGCLVLQFASITTKRTRLNAEIGDFFRKHYRKQGPSPGKFLGPFEVRIFVECVNPHRRVDADNVAKACLDALTGILWRDDSQVQRLRVDKLAAEHDRVTVSVAPAGGDGAAADALLALTEAAEALP